MSIYQFISLTSCLMAAAFGVVVFIQDSTNRTNRAFLALCLAIAYWSFCEFQLRASSSYDAALFWVRAFAFWPFVISAFAHFTFAFTNPFQKRRGVWFYSTLHAPAVVLSLLGVFTDLVQAPPVKTAWGFTYGIPETKGVRALAAGWAIVVTVYCLVLVARRARQAAASQDRRRALVVLVGLSLPVVAGAVTEAGLPLFGSRVPELTVPAYAVCCLVIAYGMWKHRLFILSTRLAAHSVVESMTDALLVLDPQRRVASANPAACRLLEYSERELPGMPLEVLMPLDAPPEHSVVADLDIFVLSKTGTRIPVSMASAVLTAGNGSTQGYTLVFRDLTARRTVEAQKEQERQFSESLVNSLPGVFYLISAGGAMVRWNRSFEEVTGYDAGELAGMLATDLFDGDDKAIIADRIGQVFEQGHASVEARFRHKDGSTIPYFFTGRHVVLDGISYLVGMGVDVSDRKRLEHALAQSQKMQAIGTLAGGIAHDFNNLLTVILGSAELALTSPSVPDEVQEDLRQIATAGKTAARLTRQLLQFSRKQAIEPKVVSLRQVLEPLAAMLKRVIGEDLKLQMRFDPKLWAVAADVSSIEQLVMNLVVNARDSLSAGGTIGVKAENRHIDPSAGHSTRDARMGSYVCLSVTDSGSGIEAEALEHLFEPFFTTKSQGKGTGLGLSVVYGIVRQHGGWIEVESRPGAGARFDVFLPRAEQGAAEQDAAGLRAQAAPPVGEMGAPLRVLLVEDEATVQRFVTLALQRMGCAVEAASSCGEALSVFHRRPERFDLLLSDVILPDGNGFELAKRIRAARPELPVLMSSGYSGTRSQAADILAHGFGYLQKPYQLDALLHAVTAAVSQARPSAEGQPAEAPVPATCVAPAARSTARP